MSASFRVTLRTPGSYIPLENRTGKLPFRLTNDYLFKIVLQRNGEILRALISSLLGLPPNDIRSIDITNAIEPGVTIDSKDSLLDIKLILNDCQIVNLEMQIRNEANWPERSLTYLCRSFDNVPKGQNYRTALPTHHIGILCFNPTGMPKQFYSHYYMMEQHSHNIYTPKFRLSVLDLTQAALATDSDKQQGLDLWAAAFRAATWEEFQMLAEKDALFKTVSDALYIVLENKDLADQIRRQWEAEAIEKHRKEEEQRMIENQKRMIENQKRMEEDQKRMEEDQKRMKEEQKRMTEDKKRMEEDQKRMTAEIYTLRMELAKAKAALTER